MYVWLHYKIDAPGMRYVHKLSKHPKHVAFPFVIALYDYFYWLPRVLLYILCTMLLFHYDLIKQQ